MEDTLEAAFLAILDEKENGRRITREWLDAHYPRWSAELAGALDLKDRLQGRVGPYRCLEELGRGGMGAVFLAKRTDGDVGATDDGEVVALKVIHRHLLARPGILTRLLNEAEACRDLRHENVVRTLDLGTVERDGTRDFYLVLEYLKGRTLREQLEVEGALSETTCLAVADAVAAALEAIHARDALHLDLKPENVFRTEDGCIKVMDFGVARIAAEPVLDAPTGAFAGTLMYAAPEQFHAERRFLDARADLYSLGVLLFELATGRLPDDNEAPGVSRFFDAVVATLLALDPADRFQCARELRAALLARQWRGRSEFVGRAAELGQLHDALDAGGAIVIEGEAGSGKSRLLEEFVADADDAGHNVVRARSLRELALERADSPALADAPVLAEALRRGTPTPDELNAALARIARGLATERPALVVPALIVVEDLHARGAVEQRAFAALARAVEGHRTLLVGTTRRGAEQLGGRHLALARLTQDDLADLATRRGQDGELAARLHDVSGGNALFAQLVLDAWREDGDDVARTPRVVEELIRSRIDRLAPAEREALDAAACLGRTDGLLIARALGQEQTDGDAFAHDLFREVAATMLDENARRPIHAALARALPDGAERTRQLLLAHETVTPGQVTAALDELRLARHEDALALIELATERVPGVERLYLLRARGHALVQLGRYDDAIATYEEALPLINEDGDAKTGVGTRIDYIALLNTLSRYAEGRRVAHEALAHARRAGDTDGEYKALRRLCDLLMFLGKGGRAEVLSRRMLKRAHAAFGRIPAIAFQNAAKAAKMAGKPDQAIRFFDDGLRAAQLPEDREAVMLIEGHYGMQLMNMGRFDEARERCRRSAAIARESGKRYPEAMVQSVLAELNERQGRFKASLAAANRTIALCEELGALDGIIRGETMRMQIGLVLNHRGLFDQAWTRMLTLGKKTETYALDIVTTLARAEWDRREQRFPAAIERLEAALVRALAIEHRSAIACSHYGLGYCLAEHNTDAARKHLETALEVAQRMQEPDLTVAAMLVLAKLPGGEIDAAVAAYHEFEPRIAAATKAEQLIHLWELTRDDDVLLSGRRLVHTLLVNAPEEYRAGFHEHPYCKRILAASEARFGPA